MRARLVLCAAAMLVCGAEGNAAAQAADLAGTPLGRRVADVAALFRADPGGYDTLFAPALLAQVPAARLTQIFTLYAGNYGSVTATELVERAGADGGRFTFHFSKGYTVPATVTVDAAPPYRIVGLWLGPAAPAAASLDAIVGDLQKLPGQVSFLAARLDADTLAPLAELDPDRPLALGSAFKLYVLAALVRDVEAGRRRWADVVTLDSAARSLPSGMMQGWPAGTPVTLQTLATMMISISDNTAADELIRTLGRANVEAMLAPTGNAHAALDRPFLTTQELFKLKWGRDSTLVGRYAAAGEAARRAMLANEVDPAPLAGIVPAGAPVHVADVEWFASASDLARLCRWLRDHTASGPAAAARGVLAVNPGLSIPKGAFRYVGFKGGSEPGVIDLSFLLETTAGRWVVLVGTWNDPAAAVDEAKFAGLMQRAIELVR